MAALPRQQYCSVLGGVVCIPMSLVCSASWVEGSDYNLVPTPNGYYLLR